MTSEKEGVVAPKSTRRLLPSAFLLSLSVRSMRRGARAQPSRRAQRSSGLPDWARRNGHLKEG